MIARSRAIYANTALGNLRWGVDWEEMEEEKISLLLDLIWQDPTNEWCGEFFSNKKPTATDFESIPAVLPAGPLSTAVIVLQLNSDDPAGARGIEKFERRPNLSFSATSSG